jgi:hypothetical protein
LYGKDSLDKEVVGTNGWKTTHLDVELRGNIETELGMITTPLAHNRLLISISLAQGVGDLITLRATKEEIVSNLAAYSRINHLFPHANIHGTERE